VFRDGHLVGLRRFLQAPRRWDRIALLAASHGVQLPALPDALALDGFLSARGLAVNDCAHSTARNRRCPDLVTQRLLKAAIAGNASPYSASQLTDIARHCTLQEDNASKVERQVLKAAGAYLLHGRLGEVFDALVTGAAAKGTFARISHPMLEGRVVRGFEGLDVGDALRGRLLAVDAEKSFIDF